AWSHARGTRYTAIRMATRVQPIGQRHGADADTRIEPVVALVPAILAADTPEQAAQLILQTAQQYGCRPLRGAWLLNAADGRSTKYTFPDAPESAAGAALLEALQAQGGELRSAGDHDTYLLANAIGGAPGGHAALLTEWRRGHEGGAAWDAFIR